MIESKNVNPIIVGLIFKRSLISKTYFAKSGETYGRRRIKADLKASYSHKKITRLISFLKLKASNYKKPLKKMIKPEVLVNMIG